MVAHFSIDTPCPLKAWLKLLTARMKSLRRMGQLKKVKGCQLMENKRKQNPKRMAR